MTLGYMSEDKDIEYYRNRCNVLEQMVNGFGEENKFLREKSNRLEEEMTVIKETVSALVARNINAKPDNKQDSRIKDKKKNLSQTMQEKTGQDLPIQTVPYK